MDRSSPVLRWSPAELWTLDLRSLALFRIGLGLTLLVDLANRARHLRAHYSDAGVWPRRQWIEQQGGDLDWSLHLATGSEIGAGAIFAGSGLCALAFALGFRTRLSGLLSWVLLFSLQQRNPHVLNGGDALLRILLFWGLMLPLARRFSIDALLLRSRSLVGGVGTQAAHPPNGARSAACLALLVQIALVYGTAALWKHDPIWRSEGSAVFYALHIDQFATAAGVWLREQPAWLRPLTHAVWWAEALGPLLLFAPFWTAPARALAVVLFLGLHAGLQIFLELGLFPLICGVAWLAVIPAQLWERIPPRRTLPADARALRPLHVPRLPARWIPAQPARRLRNLAVLWLLGLAISWNLGHWWPEIRELPGARGGYAIGMLLGLDQQWSMFAPYPQRRDGWFVAAARTRSGEHIDLLRSGARLSWSKPKRVSALYPNQRWRKYMMNLLDPDYGPQRSRFARYLCGRWNSRARSEEFAHRLHLVFMTEDARPGRRVAPVQPWTLFHGACPGAATEGAASPPHPARQLGVAPASPHRSGDEERRSG